MFVTFSQKLIKRLNQKDENACRQEKGIAIYKGRIYNPDIA